MASQEGRRSFLLGITLNELSFMMFFLLMLISAAGLQQSKQALKQQTDQNKALQTELADLKIAQEENFKRLQLLESRLMQAGGFAHRPTPQQLDELFAKLSQVSGVESLAQANARLLRELESLQAYKKLAGTIRQSGLQSSPQAIAQTFLEAEKVKKDRQLLKGRVAYMQKKLKGNGLDHPPCWADPKDGSVEYLYRIILYENAMQIEAAWPKHRINDLRLIPGAEQLAGRNLNPQQFKQQMQPVFAWSKANECRHFVRIKDDKNMSKEAFKKQLLTIENYFYKYLER